MRVGSTAFWLGIAVGFFGVVLVLLVLSAALVLLAPGGSGGSTTINYEPISLEQANSLIDSGQVYRIAIRPTRNVDEFWYFLQDEGSEIYLPGPDGSRRWKVDGVDVHVFTESAPNGMPILADDQDKIGLTSDQFDDLIHRIKQYNNTTESSPIELLDQRGESESLSVPR